MSAAMTDKLEQMLAGGRDDAMLRFGLGSAYFNSNEFPQAIVHLKACIAHDAQYSAAYKLLGKALLRTGNQDEAIQVLSAGLPIAIARGDKQSQKEIEVFLTKANRAQES